MKKLIFTFSIISIFSLQLISQVITTRPVFPSVDDTVTITYDATLGNGALVGVSPVYAHTGLITENSNGPSDWKFVQGNWGTADPDVLMTDIGNDKHRIQYHIQNFYGVPASDSVELMSFVFRDTDGNIVGRATDGSDMYYPVYPESGLFAKFVTPAQEAGIYEIGQNIQVECAANKDVTLNLYEDGNLVTSTTGDSLGATVNVTQTGRHLLELVAYDFTQEVRDSVYYVVNPSLNFQNPPAGISNGINYLNDSTVILQLTAPLKEYVYVIGDFNDWQIDPDYFMNVSEDTTRYWLEITGLTPGEEYGFQYLVDGEIRVGDPYADKILDPFHDQFISNSTYPNLKEYPQGKTNRIVTILETGQQPYQWDVTNFQKPKKTDLVIYELLIRDFLHDHDYETLTDTLDYLQDLGVNCIELMPVSEFEGNESWGYNPSFFFAVDKYYGPKKDLKRFIDTCHKRGIAVVLDMVLNHAFGQNSLVRMWWNSAQNQPAANSPYFNPIPKHDFNVGNDFNHESPYTRQFSKDVMTYWLEEYKFDGYRFDLSKGFTQKNTLGNTGAWGQYDQSRIDIWSDYSNHIWSVDPSAYVILEHFADNSEEKVLANNGMMLWGNLNHAYNETTMGYLNNSNFNWISYQQRGWNDPHVVGYMESHDEERLMFKNLEFGNSQGNYNTQELGTALERMEMAGALFYTIPGPKMLWQFGELGYDFSIDYNGRTGNKPIRWSYLEDARRLKVYKVWSALIKLRIEEPAFETDNFNLSVGGAIKRIKLNHNDMNVIAIANADVTAQNGSPQFHHTGWWYDYFSGDSNNVTDTNMEMSFDPGEYHIYTDKRLETPDTDVALGSEEIEMDTEISVFPNPATDVVYIHGSTSKAGIVEIEIFDLSGKRLITSQRNVGAGSFQIAWNTTDASGSKVTGGTYLVKLRINENVTTKKVMIVR